MRQSAGNNSKLTELSRSEEIQRQLRSLASRDVQLWSIGLLIIVVLSAGLLAVVLPSLAWHPPITINGHLLPQFLFGLIVLIALFNVYIVGQNREIRDTRREVIRELLVNERLQAISLLDPLTQLLNRRGADQIVSNEVGSANRLSTPLSLLAMRLESLDAVSGRFGTNAGNKHIVNVSKILRDTFRGSDILARLSGSKFLAILPHTTEQQSERALQRLQEAVERWNRTAESGLAVSLRCGTVSHVVGCDAGDLLRAAERKILSPKERLVPMFLPLESEDGSLSHVVL